jgi:glyceraldehyde 3-phosphate dehydrogenase
MKTTRVAINGAGRIGRAFLKLAIGNPELEIVAINDIGDIKNIGYLLKYDTVYKGSGLDVKIVEDATLQNQKLIINEKEVAYTSIKDPATLPWAAMSVDIVVESTGLFTSFEKARAHITAGAKKVVITGPVKEDPKDASEATVLMVLNEDALTGAVVTSNASCTTNAGSPLMAILDTTVGIEKALLSTVHAYTASQAIVDGPSKKDFREGRAAAQNIVPSSTGAAVAVTKVLPQLAGKFDGISIRVPVPVGSIVDITFVSKKPTDAKEINEILKAAAKDPKWEGVFAVTEDPLVSSDIVGNTHASIADLAFTRVVDGNLVKVLAWYDNEMGYTHTMVRHVITAGKSL